MNIEYFDDVKVGSLLTPDSKFVRLYDDRMRLTIRRNNQYVKAGDVLFVVEIDKRIQEFCVISHLGIGWIDFSRIRIIE
jgi:hypothetical protein